VTSFQHLAQPQALEPPLLGCQRMIIQIYSQLPSISEAIPLSATWGRAMPWWQGPTYHWHFDIYRGTTAMLPRWL